MANKVNCFKGDKQVFYLRELLACSTAASVLQRQSLEDGRTFLFKHQYSGIHS
jgi:hypothetical protein